MLITVTLSECPRLFTVLSWVPFLHTSKTRQCFSDERNFCANVCGCQEDVLDGKPVVVVVEGLNRHLLAMVKHSAMMKFHHEVSDVRGPLPAVLDLQIR
jgi:hypothetical protein